VITVTGRQLGKTTSSSCLLASHLLLGPPGTTNLIVGPSQRIAIEGVRRVRALIERAGGKLASDNQTSIEMPNRSRLISVPADPTTIRGLTVGSQEGEGGIAIIDEASRVPDELYLSAVRPMLSRYAKKNRLVLISTPAGTSGFFYRTWVDDDLDFIKLKADWTTAAHLSPEFIEQERRMLSPEQFASEWECEFIDGLGRKFFNMDTMMDCWGLADTPTPDGNDVDNSSEAIVARAPAIPNIFGQGTRF
jgi:hypothetical protein